jgi:hypothetical protein
MASYSEKDKTIGIFCDYCGKIVKSKFHYYSAKFDMVEVDTTIGKIAIVEVDRRCLDLDLCVECMEDVKKRVMSVINKREGRDKNGGWTTSVEKSNEQPKGGSPRK